MLRCAASGGGVGGALPTLRACKSFNVRPNAEKVRPSPLGWVEARTCRAKPIMGGAAGEHRRWFRFCSTLLTSTSGWIDEVHRLSLERQPPAAVEIAHRAATINRSTREILRRNAVEPQDCAGRRVSSLYAIVLLSVPIFSIQSRTVSPGLRNSGRAAPTPAGVPVRIMSPG
jgi:hypothetical protein